MIDQTAIDINAQQLVQKLQQKIPTKFSGLYMLKDVLDPTILSRLKTYIESVNPEQWQTVQGQESKPRSRISWDTDTVIEELHEIFNSATTTINDIFPDVYKHFWGISIWQDQEGYSMNWHTDNPDIDVALQLYLYTELGFGTIFQNNDTQTLIPSIHNTGYLALHTGDNKIPHKTENMVPPGVTRYSLYAVWSRSPKYSADS